MVDSRITLIGHPYRAAPHSEHSEAVRKLCHLGCVDRLPIHPGACPSCDKQGVQLFAFLMYSSPASGRWKFKVSRYDGQSIYDTDDGV